MMTCSVKKRMAPDTDLAGYQIDIFAGTRYPTIYMQYEFSIYKCEKNVFKKMLSLWF